MEIGTSRMAGGKNKSQIIRTNYLAFINERKLKAQQTQARKILALIYKSNREDKQNIHKAITEIHIISHTYS